MACFTGEHVLVGVHDLWGGVIFQRRICLMGIYVFQEEISHKRACLTGKKYLT